MYAVKHSRKSKYYLNETGVFIGFLIKNWTQMFRINHKQKNMLLHT